MKKLLMLARGRGPSTYINISHGNNCYSQFTKGNNVSASKQPGQLPVSRLVLLWDKDVSKFSFQVGNIIHSWATSLSV